MLSKFISLLVLSVFTGICNATIIITDDHVNMQVEYSLLGGTYTTSYSGDVYGLEPYIMQVISFDVDINGNYLGMSTEFNANTDRTLFGFARAESTFPGLILEVHSRRDHGCYALLPPEVMDAYWLTHTQYSYLEFSADFTVDGGDEWIGIFGMVEYGSAGHAEYRLTDHVTGISYHETTPGKEHPWEDIGGFYHLLDDHHYTLTVNLLNTARSEHTVRTDIWIDDVVVVPTPASWALLLSGLPALTLARWQRNGHWAR